MAYDRLQLDDDGGVRFSRTLEEAFGPGRHHVLHNPDDQPITIPALRVGLRWMIKFTLSMLACAVMVMYVMEV